MADKVREVVIYGQAAVEAFFFKRKDDLVRLFVREGEQGRFGEILSMCAKSKKLYRLVPNEELNVIAKTEHHEGICAVTRAKDGVGAEKLIKQYLKDFKNDPLIILDAVSNPHNLGAIIRSAVFFGFNKIIINSKSRFNLGGSLARMSEGGVEFADIAFSNDSDSLIKNLKKEKIRLLISDLEASESSIPGDLLSQPFAIVLGSESFGVSKEFRENSDVKFRIKGSGMIQSLNVSVFAGIMFNEFYQFE